MFENVDYLSVGSLIRVINYLLDHPIQSEQEIL